MQKKIYSPVVLMEAFFLILVRCGFLWIKRCGGSRVCAGAALHVMCKFLLIVGLFVAAEATAARLGAHQNVDKNRPVTKVINLLKDMQAQLQKEQETDEEVYDKLACWSTRDRRELQMFLGGALTGGALTYARRGRSNF